VLTGTQLAKRDRARSDHEFGKFQNDLRSKLGVVDNGGEYVKKKEHAKRGPGLKSFDEKEWKRKGSKMH